jgi:hypothetical protein
MCIRLLCNLILGGVLLGAACSSKEDDTTADAPDAAAEPISGDSAPAANDPGAAPAQGAPPIDLNTAASMFLGSMGNTICLADEKVCNPPKESKGKKPENAGILEVNLTNSPDRKDGEPSVAINPKDPNNLVAIYAAFLPGMLLAEEAYNCHVQYSFDRGETWTLVEPWPPEGTGPFPDCGESVIKVDADGTFYAGMNNLLNTTNVDEGGKANLETTVHIVSKSTDGGRTWTTPVQTFLISGVIKSRIDMVTGKLYHTVSSGSLFPAAMTISDDHGETWADPVQQPGNQYAVHDGILAVGVQQSNVELHVSSDDGKTYKVMPVKDSEGKAVPAGANAFADPAPWVSADPTKTGRFAVMVPRTAGLRLQGFAPVFDSFDVYVTDDSGETWSGPATLDAPWSSEPWIDFGTTGTLGVVWRAHTKPEDKAMVDVYAAVSFDQGKKFSAPVRINSESHPRGDGGPPADDWSWIAIDDKDVFITWVDVRSGETGDAIMGRIPLSVFKDATK